MSTEKVEVKVQFPEKVYHALEWYVRETSYWVSNDDKDKSISEYVADVVEEWLKMEAREPKDAIDYIKNELSLLLDLENKVEIPTAFYKHLEKIALKENKTVDQLVEEEIYKIIKGSKAEAP
jgi:predicted DNA-binding antitoxin AbrB/MazE fold protein